MTLQRAMTQEEISTTYPSPIYQSALDVTNAVRRGLPDDAFVSLGVPANVRKEDVVAFVYWDNTPSGETELFGDDIAVVHVFFIEIHVVLGRRDTTEIEAETQFHTFNIFRELHKPHTKRYRQVMWGDVEEPLSGLLTKEPSRFREALQQRAGGDNSIRVPNIVLPVIIDYGFNED